MLPEMTLFGAGALSLYHYVAYPALLRIVAARMPSHPSSTPSQCALPSVTIIVPAYNEARFIEAKVRSLASLDYPPDLLSVIIVSDGSTDATVELARSAVATHVGPARFDVVEHLTNRGKIAVLNETIAQCTTELVVLSDSSATLPGDALMRISSHFADPGVGVVCPTYELAQAGSEGERAYWQYQVEIKASEAAVGAPMGAHGACYAFRLALWRPLEPDTINDDFILPMRIVARGYRAVYDRSIVARELEVTTPGQEFRRRTRIAAGNMQQATRLWRLANPAMPGVSLVFLSGKALRAVMPLVLVAGLVALAVLAAGGSHVYQFMLAVGLLVVLAAGFAIAGRGRPMPRPLAWLGYFAEGNAAGFLGASRYLLGFERQPWGRAANELTAQRESHVPWIVEASKRAMDIVCALGALIVMTLLWIPIAVAIKLTSRGPILYRQLRVGRQSPEVTRLFWLIKFRTMYVDAETRSGAVWATKNDPRITPVGRFLRKTRLDELPQCINVLKGEMSVIGPRPERPVFFRKLEAEIPFYSERIYGLKPGITGLAQVNQAYDESIEDVRNKLLYDHAYAARITTWGEWLRTDLGIVLSTAQVMAMGKGQ